MANGNNGRRRLHYGLLVRSTLVIATAAPNDTKVVIIRTIISLS